MPIASSKIAIRGLAALVVQEPFEVISQVPNFSSLIPSKTVSPLVLLSPLAGAEMTIFFAPCSK